MKKPNNLEFIEVNHPFKLYCRDFIKNNFGKMSQREIARILKVGKTTVNNWSSLMGLKFKKHTSDDNYFKNWSRGMAYILGFIAADGNVSWEEQKGCYTMTITAAEKDKDHLEKIRFLLKSTKPLLYSESTKSYRLIVNSKEICRDLINFGIIPRKSLTIRFPKLSDDYLQDYIRGYIDGDGSLKYFKRSKSPYFELSICSGSLDFIKQLEEKIFNKLGTHSRISKTSCYILRYSCTRGLKLAAWIYKDSDFYLVRKYKKYEEALRSRKE
jgi:intein-encoded DNA endonuclease-like protein